MQKSGFVGELSEIELRAMVPQLQTLTERYKRAESIQKALFSISELSSSASNLDNLYVEIHKIVQQFMTADNFFVAFHEKQDERIQFAYFVDELDEETLSSIPYEKIKNGITAHILDSGESLVMTIENFEQLREEKGFDVLGTPPVDLMGVPLKRDGEVMGAMVVQSYNEEVRYSRDDLEILTFISQHIVTTVDRVKRRELTELLIQKRTQQLQETNAKLKGEINERKRMEALQKALFEISELSASNEDNMVTFYEKIHTILSRLIHAPNCYIAELDEQREHLTFPYFVGQHTDTNKPRKLNQGLTEYVIKEREAVLIDSKKVRELNEQNALDKNTVDNMLATGNSWLGAPLIINDEVQGVLAVQTYGSGEDYTDQDLDILRFVSQHIATAMNRRRAAEELLTYNKQLTEMVQERTAELDESNQSLKRQIEQRKEIEQKLIHDAHHDALTGLANRLLFNSRLDLAIASKQRYDEHNYALLFIDLDRFKAINDTLGHHAGDEFLKEVAKRIGRCKRSHDLLARLGGDEFVVLVDSFISISDVEQIAQRIVDSVSASFDIEGKEVFSGASIGIAEITSDYTDGDQALRDADAAMYQAKNMGRNRYVFFDISMRNQLIEEVELETEFRQAFKQGKFSCFVQPVKSAETNDTLYCAFTIGWQRSKDQLIKRSDFWALANKTGLNHALNQYLIDMAFKQLKAWHADKKTRHYKLGVSLTAEHLLHSESYENLLQMLEWSEIDSTSLMVELTEESISKFSKMLPTILKKFHDLGVGLVLDNFGNNSGSINQLFDFSFDYIKVSASLTHAISMSDKAHRLLESMTLLANNLNIQVIADGVDDDALLHELQHIGCHYLQGDLMSPVKEAQFKK